MIASIIGGAFALLGLLIAGVFGLACFAFWLWMLVHSITNKGLSDGEKVVWVLVIIFLPFIGSILYFFIGRPKGQAVV
jgi:uncharacterized membrane protein SpoIIM required for sporulation